MSGFYPDNGYPDLQTLGRLYSRKIMCRIQWHFRSNLQTFSSVWLFKEYDFVLADLNIYQLPQQICCNVVAIWRYQLPSYLTSDSRSEPINFYNILVSDRHDLTLSIISYLLSDRRSDANTILLKFDVVDSKVRNNESYPSSVVTSLSLQSATILAQLCWDQTGDWLPRPLVIRTYVCSKDKGLQWRIYVKTIHPACEIAWYTSKVILPLSERAIIKNQDININNRKHLPTDAMFVARSA